MTFIDSFVTAMQQVTTNGIAPDDEVVFRDICTSEPLSRFAQSYYLDKMKQNIETLTVEYVQAKGKMPDVQEMQEIVAAATANVLLTFVAIGVLGGRVVDRNSLGDMPTFDDE